MRSRAIIAASSSIHPRTWTQDVWGMHSRRALACIAPLEEQKPHRNLTAEQQRSLDSAYNDHSTKALNNLITNWASEGSNNLTIALPQIPLRLGKSCFVDAYHSEYFLSWSRCKSWGWRACACGWVGYLSRSWVSSVQGAWVVIEWRRAPPAQRQTWIWNVNPNVRAWRTKRCRHKLTIAAKEWAASKERPRSLND